MKKKISELSNGQLTKICKKHHPICENCPLQRKEGSRVMALCFGKLRAWFIEDIKWYKENYKPEGNITLEEVLEDLIEEERITESHMIEISEDDL